MIPASTRNYDSGCDRMYSACCSASETEYADIFDTKGRSRAKFHLYLAYSSDPTRNKPLSTDWASVSMRHHNHPGRGTGPNHCRRAWQHVSTAPEWYKVIRGGRRIDISFHTIAALVLAWLFALRWRTTFPESSPSSSSL